MRIVEQSTSAKHVNFDFKKRHILDMVPFNLLGGAGQHSWGSVTLEQSIRMVEQSTSAKFNMVAQCTPSCNKFWIFGLCL